MIYLFSQLPCDYSSPFQDFAWAGQSTFAARSEQHCQLPLFHSRRPVCFFFRWVANMRQRSDFISPQQYKDLDELGFVWTRYKIVPWATKIELLEKYKRIHGDLLVSKDYVDPETKVRLGGLVDRLRQSRDTLNIARKQELESIGFVWNAYNNHWDTVGPRCHFLQ